MHIRSPRAHVLQSLTDTCQLAMSIARMQDGVPIPRVNTDAQAAACRPLLVRRLRASRYAQRRREPATLSSLEIAHGSRLH